MKYFLSFIEQGVLNPKYKDYISARVEVFKDDKEVDELGILTKKMEEYHGFRDLWDFQEVNQRQYLQIKYYIETELNDEPPGG